MNRLLRILILVTRMGYYAALAVIGCATLLYWVFNPALSPMEVFLVFWRPIAVALWLGVATVLLDVRNMKRGES